MLTLIGNKSRTNQQTWLFLGLLNVLGITGSSIALHITRARTIYFVIYRQNLDFIGTIRVFSDTTKGVPLILNRL